MDYVIHLQYDSEAHVWTAVNDTIPLALESASLDDLMGRVKTVASEIIELNHLPRLGQLCYFMNRVEELSV